MNSNGTQEDGREAVEVTLLVNSKLYDEIGRLEPDGELFKLMVHQRIQLLHEAATFLLAESEPASEGNAVIGGCMFRPDHATAGGMPPSNLAIAIEGVIEWAETIRRLR